MARGRRRKAGVADVFRAIAAERRYQNRTWGRIEDRLRSVEEWLELWEEVSTAAYRAFVAGDVPRTLSWVLQAVAIGIALLEQHGVYERGDFDDGAGLDGVHDLAGDD